MTLESWNSFVIKENGNATRYDKGAYPGHYVCLTL